MANYMAAARTNYFRVTDEERYQELFEKLCCGDCISDFSKEQNGKLYHGFGAYDSIGWLDENEDYNMDGFFAEIQKILPDDEAFIYMESGHEKLRYVTGFSVVVTSKDIVCNDIEVMAVRKAKELLDNNFETQTCY